jgi:heptosyltransferase-2
MRAVVVQPAYLGDTVFLGPTVRALKARWPEGRVGLCVTPRGAPAARLLPGCDEVFVYDKRGADRGPSGLWRVAGRLRGFAPELALVPHRSLRSGLLARLSGARRLIGYPILCDERPAFDRRLRFVDRALELARRAGAPGEPSLELREPTALRPYAERVLAGAGRPIVGLVHGAEWATKKWGEDPFAALAGEVRRWGGTAVLLGGPADRDAGQRIQALAGEGVRDTTGNSIEEAVAVLFRCDLVVGGDTGLVHCARALGRRAVILFGPTDPRRHVFTPRERALSIGLECQPCHDHGPMRCPLGHHRCMRLLEVGAVAGAARALLEGADVP